MQEVVQLLVVLVEEEEVEEQIIEVDLLVLMQHMELPNPLVPPYHYN